MMKLISILGVTASYQKTVLRRHSYALYLLHVMGYRLAGFVYLQTRC